MMGGSITDSQIQTFSGDGYIYVVDVNSYRGTLARDRLYVDIGGGSLFEVRGRRPARLVGTSDNLVHLRNIPAFDPNTWTVEQLRVL
ncbi:MAG: hypothetical protein QHH07_02515 [Sedimentisphaerales bacterium]|jgi:hypothetical protein|nr:hypothetical protein [Sedimentisphaerales bacterium]